MSTYLYAAITKRREEDTTESSESSKPPGVRTTADSLAALVPAEVLAFYEGIVIPNVTSPMKDKAGDTVVKIDHPGWLAGGFIFCVVASVVIYIAVHSISAFDRYDLVRAAIAPLAFVAWGLLQTPSSFDVWPFSSVSFLTATDVGIRAIIAGGFALILGVVAMALGKTAEKQQGPGQRVRKDQGR